MMDMLFGSSADPARGRVDLFLHMLICGEGGGMAKRCTYEEEGQQSAEEFTVCLHVFTTMDVV